MKERGIQVYEVTLNGSYNGEWLYSGVTPFDLNTLHALHLGVEWAGNRMMKLSTSPSHHSLPKSIMLAGYSIHLEKLKEMTGFWWNHAHENFYVRSSAQNMLAILASARLLSELYHPSYGYKTEDFLVKPSDELNALSSILIYQIKSGVRVSESPEKINFLCTKPEIVRDAILYAITYLKDENERHAFITELNKNKNAKRVLVDYFFNPDNPYGCNDTLLAVQGMQKLLLNGVVATPLQCSIMLEVGSTDLRKLNQVSGFLGASIPSTETLSLIMPAEKTECENYLKVIKEKDSTGYAYIMLARSYLASTPATLANMENALKYALIGMQKASRRTNSPQAYNWLLARLPATLNISEWSILKNMSFMQSVTEAELAALVSLQNFRLHREQNKENLVFTGEYLNGLLSLTQFYRKVNDRQKQSTVVQIKLHELMLDGLTWLQKSSHCEDQIDCKKLFEEDMQSNLNAWINILNRALKGTEPLSIIPRVGELVKCRNDLSKSDVSSLNLILQQLVYMASVKYQAANTAASTNKSGNIEELKRATQLRSQIGTLLGYLQGQPEYVIAENFAKHLGYQTKEKSLFNAVVPFGKKGVNDFKNALDANPNNFAVYLEASNCYSKERVSLTYAAAMIYLARQPNCTQYVGKLTPQEHADRVERDLRDLYGNKSAKLDDRLHAGIALVRAQVNDAQTLFDEMVTTHKLTKKYFETVVNQKTLPLPEGMSAVSFDSMNDKVVVSVLNATSGDAFATNKEADNFTSSGSSKKGSAFFSQQTPASSSSASNSASAPGKNVNSSTEKNKQFAEDAPKNSEKSNQASGLYPNIDPEDDDVGSSSMAFQPQEFTTVNGTNYFDVPETNNTDVRESSAYPSMDEKETGCRTNKVNAENTSASKKYPYDNYLRLAKISENNPDMGLMVRMFGLAETGRRRRERRKSTPVFPVTDFTDFTDLPNSSPSPKNKL